MSVDRASGDQAPGGVREVHLLGTGCALPHPSHGPACTLLRCGNTRVAVDLGAGAVQKLARAGATLDALSAVILTHDHIDHIGDVATLLFGLVVPHPPRGAPLDIYATGPTLARIARWQAAFDTYMQPGHEVVRFHEIASAQRFAVGPVLVDTFEVVHAPSSVGFRCQLGDDGPTVAIPGDTAWATSVAEGCLDADLAILECSSTDDAPIAKHLTPKDLVEIVRASRLRRLAIVHRFNPQLLARVHDSVAAATGVAAFAPQDGHTVRFP